MSKPFKGVINIESSECHELAAKHPEKLEELKSLRLVEAAKYLGLPFDVSGAAYADLETEARGMMSRE